MNPWEESWDTSKVKGASPFDAALAAEGVNGPIADIARSIYQQESGSGKNTKTSNAGAVGGMQIIPSTFKSVADKDWDINDPTQNARAGVRYIKHLYEQAGGDPALTAAGYYGGPGGLEKARRGVAVADPRNPNAPTTLQYGQQVAARIPKEKGLIQRGVEAIIPSAEAGEMPAAPQAKMPWEEQWEAPPKPGKRDKTVFEQAINTAANVMNPVGALIDKATGGKASIGAVRGVKDVIDTGAGLLSRLGGAEEQARVQTMNDAGKQDFQQTYGDSAAANAARIGGNALATAPVGPVLGGAARLVGATRLGNALASGGMTVGQQGGDALANMGLRMAGGAATGGTSAALVDPESAGTGAAIGAALPPVLKGLGAAGGAVANVIRGPGVDDATRAAVQAGREAGYVIPPTQANPTLANRLLEGLSGKITTAQNASAKNQAVTNALAKNAIGADELSAEGLAAVRAKANQAYDQLGSVGALKTDDVFKGAMEKIGAASKQLKEDFPELVNKDVEALVNGFASKDQFDSQSAIEAMKRLRASGAANKANFSDSEKKALGQAQMKMASALEDLVERNLQASGRPELLDAFRSARQTLAKTYDVERAMNPSSGNIDANKLAQALKKGRPLSEDLETIARFSSSFPKATQTVERMGSLPQTSPLDWTGGAIAAGTLGSPIGLAGVLARPGARRLALSNVVQNRLAQPSGSSLALSPEAQNALAAGVYRAAPLQGSSR